MDELRVLYEKHPEQGSNIIKGITDVWKVYETEGTFLRLLKIKVLEKIAKWLKHPQKKLKFYEKARKTFFFKIRQYIVHCPYCDKYKYVSIHTEDQKNERDICCENCGGTYKAVFTPTEKCYRQKIAEAEQ